MQELTPDKILKYEQLLKQDPALQTYVKQLAFDTVDYVSKVRAKMKLKIIKKQYTDEYIDYTLGLTHQLTLNPFEETFIVHDSVYRLIPVEKHPKYNLFYRVLTEKCAPVGIIMQFSRFGDYQWYPVTEPEQVVLNSTFGIGDKQRCLEYLHEHLIKNVKNYNNTIDGRPTPRRRK